MPRHHSPGGAGRAGFGRDGDTVHFTFSSDNTQVVSMTVDHGAYTRSVDISGDQFTTVVDTVAGGKLAVVAVERTQTLAQLTHTTVYYDAQGEGDFAVAFDIGVVTDAQGPWAETHKFAFAPDGSVAAEVEIRGNRLRGEDAVDSIDYQTFVLGAETYVVKTVQLANEDVRFEVARDDDGDGTWTTIASGHIDAAAAAAYVDDGGLDLAGVLGYLDVAAAVVG